MNSSATAYPDDAAHSYAFAAAAALAAGLLCAAYVLHSTRLGHTKQEPPVVPYSLPLIGNTLAFGKNIGAFYAHARCVNCLAVQPGRADGGRAGSSLARRSRTPFSWPCNASTSPPTPTT